MAYICFASVFKLVLWSLSVCSHVLQAVFKAQDKRDVAINMFLCIYVYIYNYVLYFSVAQSCPTLCDPVDCKHQASLSFTISQGLLRLMSIESVMPSNHHHPLSSPSPSIFPSIGVFSNESVLHIGWPKVWSFSFSINPSNEYSGLISFRIDWFDLFAVQGTLKSLLQNHTSKASILRHSAFFMVQLSHP